MKFMVWFGSKRVIPWPLPPLPPGPGRLARDFPFLKGDNMHLILQTKEAPAAIGPYSQGLVAGDLVFVSGQLGLDPQTGEMNGADLESQARQALSNLQAVLKAAECDLSHVTAVDVFLTDMGDFADFNAIYESFFDTHKPARAVVGVKSLPKNGRIEIKCMAHR
jgi:2-iminobutanoate/2-iminopropanoate deaminase